MNKKENRKYGLNEDQYTRIISEATNCPLCGIELTDEPQKPNTKNIDHCHVEGVVRGVLCRDCNQGLGKFKDNGDALKRAVVWIRSRGTWRG